MNRPHVYQNGMRGVLTDDGRFAPGVTSIPRHAQDLVIATGSTP